MTTPEPHNQCQIFCTVAFNHLNPRTAHPITQPTPFIFRQNVSKPQVVQTHRQTPPLLSRPIFDCSPARKQKIKKEKKTPLTTPRFKMPSPYEETGKTFLPPVGIRYPTHEKEKIKRQQLQVVKTEKQV